MWRYEINSYWWDIFATGITSVPEKTITSVIKEEILNPNKHWSEEELNAALNQHPVEIRLTPIEETTEIWQINNFADLQTAIEEDIHNISSKVINYANN